MKHVLVVQHGNYARMNNLTIYKKNNYRSSSGAHDVAEHLVGRMYYGKAVIVADNPLVFIGVLRKQWLKLMRSKQKERAATLNANKIAELAGTINYMGQLRFTREYPPDEYPGDVYIVSLADALRWPPDCSTMYIVSRVQQHEKYLLTAWLSRVSLAVIYERIA